jgi:tetratricopeptide (TPR) repeat protein
MMRPNGGSATSILPVIRETSGGLFVLVLLAALSCGRESTVEKARREYDAGRYRETVLVVRHYLKTGGESSGELLFILGKAWLKTGNEAEAKSTFEECRRKDPARAPEIARFLQEEAISSLGAGDLERGKSMMTMALSFQQGLDFGPYDVVAGELYLGRREYDTAIEYLDRFLDQHAGSAQAAQATIDLATAYQERGDTERAIELYRRFQERYPKSRLASNALWKLETLLLNEAETFYGNGSMAEAETLLIGLASTAGNRLVKERADFMLAEICERRGDVRCAMRHYRNVVDSGSSARLVEKAKERIEVLGTSKRRR